MPSVLFYVFPLVCSLNLLFEVYSSCLFPFNFRSTYKILKILFYILSSLTSARESVDPIMQNEALILQDI